MEKKRLAIYLIIMLSLTFIIFGCANKEDAKQQFQELKTKWESEIKGEVQLSSVTYNYWEGEAGRRIIAMGKRALLFVMDEIENGNFLFNVPAEKITGIKMEGRYEQERSRNWIRWWERNRNNPEWNIFISSPAPK